MKLDPSARTSSQHATKVDLFQRVTNQIIASIEAGTRPWTRPWNASTPQPNLSRPLRANGQPYRGINILLLWAEANAKGYASTVWLTYRQAQALGSQIRRGETGTLVVYAGQTGQTTRDQNNKEQGSDQVDDTQETKGIPFLKSYVVFNQDQIDGLPDIERPDQPTDEVYTPNEIAKQFFNQSGADIRHGGDRAYYSITSDHIQLPKPEAFETPEDYIATAAHELAHWTGHPGRLHREFGKRFGDQAYAVEELVAELAAAFICADLQICTAPREDHAAYLACWLEVLKQDKKAIFAAATQAQRVVDHLTTR